MCTCNAVTMFSFAAGMVFTGTVLFSLDIQIKM